MDRGAGRCETETVVGWHRAGFRLFWKWRSRARGGRSKTTAELRALTWGAPKIHGELQKLGFVVSETNVGRYLLSVRRIGDPGKQWLTFLANHREVIAAFDFFTDFQAPLLLLRYRAQSPEDSALQPYMTVSGHP
jgi:hypothetical protein